MAEVNLSIYGKAYGIACDDGQEDRVLELGKYVDARLREIASAGAAANDSHLLVLTALVMADEIYELRERMKEIQEGNGDAAAAAMSEEEERMINSAIHSITERINSVSSRLEKIRA